MKKGMNISIGTPMMAKIQDPYITIARLEAKIAELELKLADAESYFDGVHTEASKSCDGCKWLVVSFGCTNQDKFGNSACARWYKDLPDYYEQKDD